MKWNPILPEREKEIKKIIKELVSAIIKSENPESKFFNLVAGKVGLITLLGYVEKEGLAQYTEKIEELLGEVTHALENETMDSSLHYGFAGIAWVYQHLANISYFEGFDPANLDEIDSHVFTGIEKNFELKNYDLLAGMVGQGIYLLERMPHPGAKKYLEKLVDLFESMSEKDDHGIYWREYRHWDVENYQNGKPKDVLNLGVAHGMPAITGLLAHLYKAGVNPEKTKQLLTQSMNWLLHHSVKNKDYSFDYTVDDQVESDRPASRLAWCYGDPGVSIVLLQAGLYTQNQEWIQKAVDVALLSTKRKLDQSGVVDTGLCHGGMGLVHIYNRFYQVTQKEEFKEAVIYWLDETLRMRKPELGMGGFFFTHRDKDKPTTYSTSFGWLEGGVGISLILLSLISKTDPSWDIVFMTKV